MKNIFKNWKRKHWIIASVIASILLLPMIALGILGTMLLTTQQYFPRPEITPDDWMRQSRVVMKTMQKVLQEDPYQIMEIKLKPEEAASMLKFVVNNDQISGLFSGKGAAEGVQWTLAYDQDGRLHAAYLADTGIGSLRCLLRVTALVEYADDTFKITPLNCSAGSLTIPNSTVSEHVLPKVLEELERDSYVQSFHQAVESVKTDSKKRLIIRFIPANAKALVQNFI